MEHKLSIQPKDKKIIWICIGILAVLYFARNAALSYLQAKHNQQVQQAVMAQRAAAVKGYWDAQAKAVAAKVEKGEPVVPVPYTFMGRFQGAAALPPRRGMCIISLTVTPVPGDVAKVQGYSNFSCGPALADIHKDALTSMMMSGGLDPASAIMTGAMEDGKLHFKVTQNVGVNRSVANCPMTSATATPFATGIAFDWKEDGDCGGGQMVLNRGGR